LVQILGADSWCRAAADRASPLLSNSGRLAPGKNLRGTLATIVKNQKTILASQGACKKNPSALNQIRKNQKQILAALKK